jgi:hypothetical protein
MASEITGYASRAKLWVGSNGDEFGAPECFVGTSSSAATGRRQWDANLADGLDSEFVVFSFTAQAAGGSGGLALAVNGASPSSISFSSAPQTTIGSIKIRVAVEAADRKASLRNVVVKFFLGASDTTAFETKRIGSASAPVANTMGEDDPVSVETAINVFPARTDYQKVVVTAEVRFECLDTLIPSEDGLLADVFLFA